MEPPAPGFKTGSARLTIHRRWLQEGEINERN
jgi:hypothetical protein